MKKILQDMAQEISQNLAREIDHGGAKRATSLNFADLLLERLSEEVINRLDQAASGQARVARDIEAGARDRTRPQERLPVPVRGEGEEEMADFRSRFPNLKYAKSKYQDIESVLKYIEADDDKGGVRLVIMNFND